jgi:hypothetical protein
MSKLVFITRHPKVGRRYRDQKHCKAPHAVRHDDLVFTTPRQPSICLLAAAESYYTTCDMSTPKRFIRRFEDLVQLLMAVFSV